MYGAIIGDLAGSIYEYEEFQDSLKKKIDLKRRLEILHKKELISEHAFYSDDTILTIAILESILKNISFEKNLKKYGLEYKNKVPKGRYFKYMFSPNFIKWCETNTIGTSNGNGAAMRISSVGYLYDDIDVVMEKSRLATIPSHNTESAIQAAEVVATIIFLARSGYLKKDIKNELQYLFNYNYELNLKQLQEKNLFSSICDITIPQCLYILFETNSFEEAIRTSISIGGDTDTIAAIVGSMAEAIYGIPKELKEKANEFLPQKFQDILTEGYSKIKKLT